MDYLPFQTPMYGGNFAHHPSHGLPMYREMPIRTQAYEMSPPLPQLTADTHNGGDRNDTKPRLAKQEVELLESHFQDNHKPPSSLKRQLADRMGVDVARINNWFQNRRAKAKQEAKQMDYDMKNGGAREYSEPSSPDAYTSGLFGDELDQFQESHDASLIIAQPPAAVSCNPSYADPTAASLSSLQRAMLAAEAAVHNGEFSREFPEEHEKAEFGGPLYGNMASTDRAQFPSNTSMTPFNFEENIYTSTTSFGPASNNEPFTDFLPLDVNNNSLTFPSQLLGNVSGQDDSASMRFKSPPPPSDIAARRMQRRPAPIGTAAIEDHTSMGPRTVSHSNVLNRRPNRSPSASMRRVVSVGANLNVIAGRIQKSNLLPQRSPLVRHFSYEGRKFMDMNNFQQLSTGALFSSGLAPPTPNSPQDLSRLSNEEDDLTTSESSYEQDNEHERFIYTHPAPGALIPANGLTLASPPETPHNPQGFSHWGYEVADEIIHTPSYGSFPSEMQIPMQQPQYVSPSINSQPATPAFGFYNGMPASFPISSPQFEIDQSATEYRFPDNSNVYYSMINSAHSSPEQPKQHQQFVFHNSSVDDFESKSASGASPSASSS